MSKAAFTVRAFAIYVGLLGITLVVAPNMLLTLFGMPATSEVWIRVVGVLAFNVGVYYWYGAMSEARPFFQATVYARAAVPFVFLVFVWMGLVSPVLVFFGVVDLAGGLWTLAALKADRRAT